MVKEARVTATAAGDNVESDGWFVLNLAAAGWKRDPDHGLWCGFEASSVPFEDFGINVHVVMPGQPNARYHREGAQEGLLILSGTCIVVVEGQERELRQWDYIHFPAGTAHVAIGAGNAQCAILMVGARKPESGVYYPVDALAAQYGASVEHATHSSKAAYADQSRVVTPVRATWPPRAT